MRYLSYKLYRFLSLAKALLVSQYSLMLEYRAEIALWALSGVLPLIMLALWTANESDILNLADKTYFTRYFISAFIVRQFTAVWVMISFEEDNLEGRLSPYLLQPITPFWRYISAHIAEQFTRIPFVIIILSFVFLIVPNAIWIPKISTLLLALIAIVGAFWLRFLLHWIFATLCFWNDKASSVERLLLIPYLFLSGMVAPLDTYPPLIKNIALATPYPYILSFPAQILSEGTVDILDGIKMIILWIILLIFLSVFAWRAGVRKYSAMGA